MNRYSRNSLNRINLLSSIDIVKRIEIKLNVSDELRSLN